MDAEMDIKPILDETIMNDSKEEALCDNPGEPIHSSQCNSTAPKRKRRWKNHRWARAKQTSARKAAKRERESTVYTTVLERIMDAEKDIKPIVDETIMNDSKEEALCDNPGEPIHNSQCNSSARKRKKRWKNRGWSHRKQSTTRASSKQLQISRDVYPVSYQHTFKDFIQTENTGKFSSERTIKVPSTASKPRKKGRTNSNVTLQNSFLYNRERRQMYLRTHSSMFTFRAKTGGGIAPGNDPTIYGTDYDCWLHDHSYSIPHRRVVRSNSATLFSTQSADEDTNFKKEFRGAHAPCHDKRAGYISRVQGTAQSISRVQGTAQSISCVKEPTQSNFCVREPAQSTSCVEEPAQSTSCVEEPAQSTSCVEEPAQSTSCVEEPAQSTSCVEETAQSTSCVEETAQSTSCVGTAESIACVDLHLLVVDPGSDCEENDSTVSDQSAGNDVARMDDVAQMDDAAQMGDDVQMDDVAQIKMEVMSVSSEESDSRNFSFWHELEASVRPVLPLPWMTRASDRTLSVMRIPFRNNMVVQIGITFDSSDTHYFVHNRPLPFNHRMRTKGRLIGTQAVSKAVDTVLKVVSSVDALQVCSGTENYEEYWNKITDGFVEDTMPSEDESNRKILRSQNCSLLVSATSACVECRKIACRLRRFKSRASNCLPSRDPSKFSANLYLSSDQQRSKLADLQRLVKIQYKQIARLTKKREALNILQQQ